MDAYLLPGLGADHRLFTRLKLDVAAVHHLDHPIVPRGAPLKDFAEALEPRIDASRPHVLIGVSMGGMVAQELAAITRPAQVILISSWKGPEEMPWSIRLLRGTHPERVLTRAVITRSLPVVRWEMGVSGPEETALFDALVKACPVESLKTQINACLTWPGPEHSVDQLVHIHGDKDRLMPIGSIKEPVVIKGGTHFMVFNKAREVGAAVNEALAGLPSVSPSA